MFEYDADCLRIRNTHEWVRGGITSHLEDLQDAPVTMIAWLHRFLIQGKAVMIGDVAKLPRAAGALRTEMLRQDDKSVLSVPGFYQGGLRICIGFDATAESRVWDEPVVQALSQCAHLIALARYSGRGGQYHAAVNKTARPFAPLIYLRTKGGFRGVVSQEIIGLRSARNYTEIRIADGSVVVDHRALAVWLAMLPKATFLRINRTAIVNLLHVRNLDRRAGTSEERWDLHLRLSDEPWTVSRPYRTELRTRLGV